MKALERLRALEIYSEGPHPVPTEPTKGAFGGFVSTPRGTSENILPVAEPARWRHWRVIRASGEAFELFVVPSSEAGELAALYPGAKVEPVE